LSNTGHEVTTACDGDRSRPTVHHADRLYPISVNFAEAVSNGRSAMKKRIKFPPRYAVLLVHVDNCRV
jgi:hypothetical protein